MHTDNNQVLEPDEVQIARHILEIIRDTVSEQPNLNLTVSYLRALLNESYGSDYGRPITARWLGQIIRNCLKLSTYQSKGVYLIQIPHREHLKHLYEQFGVLHMETDFEDKPDQGPIKSH